MHPTRVAVRQMKAAEALAVSQARIEAKIDAALAALGIGASPTPGPAPAAADTTPQKVEG